MSPRSLNAQGRVDENTQSAHARAAHEVSLAVQNEKAAHVIASRAHGIDDCIELLAMLGLDACAARHPH
jgi:hypothetical protein